MSVSGFVARMAPHATREDVVSELTTLGRQLGVESVGVVDNIPFDENVQTHGS